MASAVTAISNLFSEETHLGILDYFDNHLWKVTPSNKENQCGRFTWNDLSLFEKPHNQLVDLVSEIFEEPVVPTYTCTSLYHDGIGTLPPHVDRDQCRYTVSYMIRCSDLENWPIYVSDYELSGKEWEDLVESGDGLARTLDEIKMSTNSNKWIKIDHHPNSAAFFSGTRRWHYREKITAGSAETVLFHYEPLHP